MGIGGRPAIPVAVQREFWAAVRSGMVAAEARQIAQQQLPGAAVTKTSLDDEDGRATWEVDLTRNHHGYEVNIDAATGKIISTHTDGADDGNGDNEQAAPAGNTATAKVSAAEARQIAQQQLPGAAVTQTSLDREHGRAVWEVDLTRNHHGYEVSIDAATGNVVSAHTDDHD